MLEETLRDTIGGAKAALLEGTLDEGPEWDIGYTSKKRCTDIEGQTKAGQRACCIPRLQTLTWKVRRRFFFFFEAACFASGNVVFQRPRNIVKRGYSLSLNLVPSRASVSARGVV